VSCGLRVRYCRKNGTCCLCVLHRLRCVCCTVFDALSPTCLGRSMHVEYISFCGVAVAVLGDVCVYAGLQRSCLCGGLHLPCQCLSLSLLLLLRQVCSICMPGWYAKGGEKCEQCPLGFFSNTTGAIACTECDLHSGGCCACRCCCCCRCCWCWSCSCRVLRPCELHCCHNCRTC
jgi:hypothetical protein